MEGQRSLRIVSFNVNGLKAALKRKFGSVSGLLREVNADILCLQETKLRRSELDRELALVEGWDSFFACAQSPRGYAGTATFVRSSLALPQAAEEGFSGLCAAPLAAGGATVHPALADKFSVEELQELDSEGRVLITDHSTFVLFNIYGPALTAEDETAWKQRLAFKLRFYEALEARWEDYLRQGRAVLAVGDLNICPAPIDRADPDPDFYNNARPDRLWLLGLIDPAAAATAQAFQLRRQQQQQVQQAQAQQSQEQQLPAGPSAPGQAAAAAAAAGRGAVGRFRDVFRVFHPHRRQAFSCWRTATSARVNNYGSRIDLVLSAGLPIAGLGGGAPPRQAGPASLAPGGDGRCSGSSCAPPAAPGEVGASGVAAAPAAAPAAAGGNAVRELFLRRAQPDSSAAQFQQQRQQQQQQVPARDTGTQAWQLEQREAPGVPPGVPPEAPGRPAVWLSGCDIMAAMEGSDHAPVWVDVSYRQCFPCAASAPPCSTRNTFIGKQLKLHGWLGGGGKGPLRQAEQGGASASAGAGKPISHGFAAAQPAEACGGDQSGGSVVDGSSGAPWDLGTQASASQASSSQAVSALRLAPRGPSSQKGGRGGGGKAGKKQASLRGFFFQPSSTQQEQQQQQQQQQQCADPPGTSAAATDVADLEDNCGAAADCDQGSAEAVLASQSAVDGGGGAAEGLPWGGQGGSGGAPSSAAAATDAWRRIQQQMAAPKCRHGEPAVLKRVNKSGENHGRYFYVCKRPAGTGREGQCNFFQWVKKRPGDHPVTTAGGRSENNKGGKRSKA